MSESTFFKDYYEKSLFRDNTEKPTISHKLETRTRRYDVTDALRFRVHDPLWMLTRQWQLGEFRGNDAGTAMSVKCRVRTTPIDSYTIGKNGETQVGATADTPLEPLVERIDREITPIVRVESATFFTDLLLEGVGKKEALKVLQQLKEIPTLVLKDTDLAMNRSSIDDPKIQELTNEMNPRLNRFKASCQGKTIDGYKLFKGLELTKQQSKDRVRPFDPEIVPLAVRQAYCKWFKERYLPNSSTSSAWDTQSLGHQFTAKNAYGEYLAGDYVGGRVSWYSFDLEKERAGGPSLGSVETIDSLPTLASYPGAPNKRLWQFEDRKVFLGNSTKMQAKGNIAFMQYATMYGNDWMLFPLKTEVGKYIQVESITVYDSFGIPVVIKDRAGKKDKGANTFGQKWQMFTNAPIQTESQSAQPANGLLFPPSLIRTLEGEPIEKVNLLRDEMANMVWGVETRIDDGCGSSLDASLLASEVNEFVEDAYKESVEKARLSVTVQDGKTVLKSSRKADYKYVLMNSVPFNWIPFIPQHIKSEEEKKEYKGFLGSREVILRRGKMPCYYDGKYHAVRPMSSILKVKPATQRDGSPGETPLFINEEQVQGVGTLIVKNCQRSRWIGGKTYTWMGYSKEVQQTQGVSGLEFDSLHDAAEK